MVSYAQASYSYATFSHNDQTRLNLIRLEVHRIQIGVRRQILAIRSNNIDRMRPDSRASCLICHEPFLPSTEILTSFCGHVYCRSCYVRTLNSTGRCGLCAQQLSTSGLNYRLYFRYNIDYKVICRQCVSPFTHDTTVVAFRCGDVFCELCFNMMTTKCLGCFDDLEEVGGFLRTYTLHLAFH